MYVCSSSSTRCQSISWFGPSTYPSREIDCITTTLLMARACRVGTWRAEDRRFMPAFTLCHFPSSLVEGTEVNDDGAYDADHPRAGCPIPAAMRPAPRDAPAYPRQRA